MELKDLDSEDRLRLMRFVCSFAWADLEIADAEKSMVKKLISQLELSEEEQAEVNQWLKIPPPPESIDPTDIPREHRQLFLTTALQMVGADGVVDEREVENLALFERLIR
jgi:uncharacterized tellurite resistance protein B-like protein